MKVLLKNLILHNMSYVNFYNLWCNDHLLNMRKQYMTQIFYNIEEEMHGNITVRNVEALELYRPLMLR